MVENKLQRDRVPAIPDPASRFWVDEFPQTSYDFFPYSGLHRPVLLCALPEHHVHDLTVITGRDGPTGLIDVALAVAGGWSGPAWLTVTGGARPLRVPLAVQGGSGQVTIRVPAARLWSPADPFLYRVTVSLGGDAPLVTPPLVEERQHRTPANRAERGADEQDRQLAGGARHFAP